MLNPDDDDDMTILAPKNEGLAARDYFNSVLRKLRAQYKSIGEAPGEFDEYDDWYYTDNIAWNVWQVGNTVRLVAYPTTDDGTDYGRWRTFATRHIVHSKESANG